MIVLAWMEVKKGEVMSWSGKGTMESFEELHPETVRVLQTGVWNLHRGGPEGLIPLAYRIRMVAWKRVITCV